MAKMYSSKADVHAAFLGHEAKIGPAVAARQLRIQTRLKWYGDNVQKLVRVHATGRLLIAAQMLRDAIVANISRPVFKYAIYARQSAAEKEAGVRRKRKTTVYRKSRSKPGEFPRADTTTLMKSVFYMLSTEPGQAHSASGTEAVIHTVAPRQNVDWAIVGTPLVYGRVLEMKLNRSFLRRTLNDKLGALRTIMAAKMER